MMLITEVCTVVLLLQILGGDSLKVPENDTCSFAIDYENDQFLKDGKPFRYISGSMHYFRTVPSEWRDRLRKLRMAGFNAVQTYIEWASHEPEPDVYDFHGILDLETFIRTAQEEDLLVILRPGPFIDAERDMGGLPYWLLRKNKDMKLRSSDPTYVKEVDDWYVNALFPKIKPLLYANGGPVIMIQVENEYGSYSACDYAYTTHLRSLYKEAFGDSVVLFTTDGAGTGYLKCGKIQDVYSTVDFGAGGDASSSFEPMRLFEPRGPLVNSEFYPGWLDHWGEPHSQVDSQSVAKSLDDILKLNASVNMYMFHGGTSFGFGAGANLGSSYQACPTSYDYDAPLSEAGDPTEKYWVLRNITQKYLPLPAGDVPPPSPKYSYGKVNMTILGSILQLGNLLNAVNATYPLTFEDLYVSNGIVVYQTTIPFRTSNPAKVSITDVHDRAYIFVDQQYVGVVSREESIYDLPLQSLPNQTLTIVAESQGRICYGSQINDFKGLTRNVTLSGQILENWKMVPLPLTNITAFTMARSHLEYKIATMNSDHNSLQGTPTGGMSFYKGTFKIPSAPDHPQDTFLRLDGWMKGVAWVNDFNLGRYWPEVGPQVTLYVPRAILKQGSNSIYLLEQEASPCAVQSSCYVSLQNTHEIAGPTPDH
ncbi:beta-galactosidase-like [Macrobrachium nipponense]|uniref:beta-galactosidase-like n=1 Tax=Macrobrachium nipponense TaxID=159736 RepID=UPI0030C83C1E